MSIKGSLVNNGRCPKCTLKPPCKHYANQDELAADMGKQQSPRGGKPPMPVKQSE
jgi:hypothetical protein